jgi:sugar O-acyltransferase (sialic acid O-acetyltransferase NeuD family)
VATTGRRLLLLGGGGHGKVVASVAKAAGHEIVAVVDRDPARVRRSGPLAEQAVIAESELMKAIASSGKLPLAANGFAFGIGDNQNRLSRSTGLESFDAPPLIHPLAAVDQTVLIDSGVVVMAAAVINADARIGRAVIINTSSVIEHDCVLGAGAHISPGAILAGNVRVGERTWIGAGAVVIHGVSIGSDVIVGAGAVVLRDVADRTTVVGNPAHPIPRRS